MAGRHRDGNHAEKGKHRAGNADDRLAAIAAKNAKVAKDQLRDATLVKGKRLTKLTDR